MSALRSTALAALACALAACHALDRDRYYSLLDARRDATSDATATDGPRTDAARPEAGPLCIPPDAAPAGDGGCNPVHPPARPSALRDTTNATTVVYAVRDILFGFDPAHMTDWRAVGFDLDDYCTDPASNPAQSCRPGIPGRPSLDGDRGRDNAFSSTVAPALALLMPGLSEADINSNISTGLASWGIRLTDLGGPDDARFTMEWLPLLAGAGAGGAGPRWDGTDRWSIDRRIAYDPGSPGMALVRSESAYATCGTLVAPLPARVPMRFRTRHFELQLTLSQGAMVGPVRADRSVPYLEFTGLWPISDALRDLTASGICANSPLFTQVQAVLGAAADLRFDGTSVVDTPDQPCNAFSVSFRITLVPITLSADATSTGVDGGC